jgi:fido (protein-threonine AMPylation protein)
MRVCTINLVRLKRRFDGKLLTKAGVWSSLLLNEGFIIHLNSDGKPVYMKYARSDDTPKLMARWIKEFNRKICSASSPTKAVNVYAWAHLSFVRIHPFFDGNGRIARLIANLPDLKCGYPPLLIALTRRAEYIDLLWSYENAVGVIKPDYTLLSPHAAINTFKTLLREEWRESLRFVEEARRQARQRDG